MTQEERNTNKLQWELRIQTEASGAVALTENNR